MHHILQIQWRFLSTNRRSSNGRSNFSHFSEIYMQSLETTDITTADHPPKVREHHVDDVFLIVHKIYLQELLEHINNLHPQTQFTKEEDDNFTLPLFDTLVQRNHDETILVKIYRKPTHTNQYLKFTSHNPISAKQSVITALFDRADNVVSNEKDKTEEKHRIWVHQEVGNEVEFLKSFVQRIGDIYKQKWFLDINESPKLSTYSQFKSLLEPEKYLHVINSFWARKHLAKFRTSNHDLAIEKGRHAKIERHMRMCNMCNLGCVEDEYHFILICPKYEYLREKYLPWRFRNFPSSAKFIDLMSSNNDQTVISLSTFIYQAFKVRKHADRYTC